MLFINNDYLIIQNNSNDTNYILNRKTDEKKLINKDMFILLKHIYDAEVINVADLVIFEDVIQELLSTNIILEKNEYIKSEVISVIEKDSIERIFLELTKKCNLNCAHCYNDSNILCEDFLAEDEIFKLIDNSKEKGVIYFQITGGEPLLRVDINRIINYLYQRGFVISIFTNLTNISIESVNLFKECSVKCITSLDFHDYQRHDKLRGVDGAYDATLNNIVKLKKAGVGIRVNFMINDKSISDLNNIMALFKKLEVDYIGDVIIPIGRALNIKEYMDMEEISKLYAYINSNKYITINTIEEAKACDYSELECYDCKVGSKFIFIDYQGNFILCPSLRKEYNEMFYFGNIKTDKIDSAVKKMKEKVIGCKYLEKCDRKEVCGGGCRARAYHLSGNINDPDKFLCSVYGMKPELFI